MNKKSSNTLDVLKLVLFALGIGTPGIVYIFKKTNDVFEAIKLLAIYIITAFVLGFLYKIYQIFEDEFLSQMKLKVRRFFSFLIGPDSSKYFAYLVATNKYLDTRQIVGPEIDHHIVLEDIYIPINFGYFYPRAGNNIFEVHQFFKKDGKTGRKYVIVGKPGSGKTTLLRYITILLATKANKINKTYKLPTRIPIFLTLEDYGQVIKESPNIPLPQLIHDGFQQRGINVGKNWLKRELDRGNCVVLLDGLDQVAESSARKKVVDWVQDQMNIFSKNNFLITSRPHGYFNNQLVGVEILITKEFTREQVYEFIKNWYLINEKQRSQPKDPTVYIRAEQGSNKLITRLSGDEGKDLSLLAQTPLLLTMIVVVFSSRENLPGKRVELYEDMIEVNLDQRYRKFVALADPLTRLQKEKVLSELAYHMMLNHESRIKKIDLHKVIETPLASVSTQVDKEYFVRLIKEVYGILIEVEENEFEFTHKTFQEYLASIYFKEENRQNELINKLADESWDETIRLYCAQTDATQIIEKCLEIVETSGNSQDDTKIAVLRLASNILNEAESMQPNIRTKLETVLETLANDKNQEKRALSAQTKLSARIRFMKKLADNIYIDENLITIGEYQLFLDEMRHDGYYYCPDHWECPVTPFQPAFSPILGARPSDMQQFCDWITRFDKSPTLYRLPQKEEALQSQINDEKNSYFIKNFNDPSVSLNSPEKSSIALSKEKITKQIENDLKTNRNLFSAYERAKRIIPTTSEILARTDSTPIGGGGGFKKTVDLGTGSLFSPELDEIRDNNKLLEVYIILAKLLNFNLSNYVNAVQSQGNVTYTNWHSAKMEKSSLVFDIGLSCKRFSDNCKTIKPILIFDGKTSTVWDELLLAVNLLQTRYWIGASINIPNHLSAKELYQFLRWYTRIGLVTVINHSWKKSSSFDSFGVNKKIFDEGMSLLFDLLVLEERINGANSLIEGIRIVKEVRNPSR